MLGPADRLRDNAWPVGKPEFQNNKLPKTMSEKIEKTDTEWQQTLTPEQYYVLRQKGTERPGTGALLHNHETGTYLCAACNQELFSSDAKFESGTGWPSFFQP